MAGMRALQPSQAISPAVTSTRPSGSAVTVGYQRPAGRGATELQAWLAGSKMVALVMPTWGLVWPPATNTRPSASRAWPEQKRLAVKNGTGEKALLAGADNWAPGWAPVPAGESDHIRTLPVGRRVMWNATSGPART